MVTELAYNISNINNELLTQWLGNHPGKEAIEARLAEVDSTMALTMKHLNNLTPKTMVDKCVEANLDPPVELFIPLPEIEPMKFSGAPEDKYDMFMCLVGDKSYFSGEEKAIHLYAYLQGEAQEMERTGYWRT